MTPWIVGGVIWSALLFVAVALCKAGAEADEQAERMCQRARAETPRRDLDYSEWEERPVYPFHSGSVN